MQFRVNGRKAFAATGNRPFDNDNPAVVFLHGAGFDHSVWSAQSRYLASQGYAVLAPDLPGHGNSAGPPLESIEAMAGWLGDAMTALGVRDVSLVGHSQGGLIALEFAAHADGRLRSVSLVASGLATPVNEKLLAAASDDPAAAIGMITRWGFRPADGDRQEPETGTGMVAEAAKVLGSNAPGALAADLGACNSYGNGKAAAAAIVVPVQVIVAGRDRMVPGAMTDELVAHLANPEVAVLADSGHMVPAEAPDRCGALLRDFIFRQNPAVT